VKQQLVGEQPLSGLTARDQKRRTWQAHCRRWRVAPRKSV